jgi:hypothetical protein
MMANNTAKRCEIPTIKRFAKKSKQKSTLAGASLLKTSSSLQT